MVVNLSIYSLSDQINTWIIFLKSKECKLTPSSMSFIIKNTNDSLFNLRIAYNIRLESSKKVKVITRLQFVIFYLALCVDFMTNS